MNKPYKFNKKIINENEIGFRLLMINNHIWNLAFNYPDLLI